MGNYSRNTFKPEKRYVSVRLQQGVPLVDSDWNEAHDIRKAELETFLKTFVGDGVPGKDDFKISAINDTDGTSAADDFTIGAGSCLVNGWTVMNESDIRYTRQAGVPALNTVPEGGGDRTDMVYLDVWEREVAAKEDTSVVNEAIGVETCVRMKREWVVRVAEGSTAPPTPPEDHFFYALATLHRKANQVEIDANDVTDLRHTGLTLASLKERTDSLEMDKVDRAGDRITGDLVVDGGLDLLTSTPYGLRARTTETQDGTSARIAVEAPAEQGKIEIDWINKASDPGGGWGLLQVGKNINSPPLSLRAGYMELFLKDGTVTIGRPDAAPGIVLTDTGDFNASGNLDVHGTATTKGLVIEAESNDTKFVRRLSVFTYNMPGSYVPGHEHDQVLFHIQTPNTTNVTEMWRYDLRGYAYGARAPLDLVWVGYFYQGIFANDRAYCRSETLDAVPSLQVSQYIGSNQHLYLRFGPINHYCLNFTLDYQSGGLGEGIVKDEQGFTVQETTGAEDRF